MVEDEIYYQTLYEQSLDAILLTAPDGNIFSANPAACRMFQRTEEDICKIGRNGLVDISDPLLSVLLEERERTGKAFGELTMLRKDGTKFPVELSTSVFINRNGEKRTSMIIRDISERKLAEEAAAEKEQRLSESQHIAHIGSWKHDLNKGIIWSDETFHLFGKSPDFYTPTNESFYEFIHPDDKHIMLEWIEECRSGKNSGEFEFRIILPDGTIRYLVNQGKLVFGVDNKPLYLAGTSQDITERKLAEEKLRKSEEKYRNLFNNSEIGMFRTRLDGSEILEFNEKYLKILGYTYEEVKGKSSRNMWVDKRERDKMVKMLKDEGKVTDFECELLTKKGDVIICLTSLRLYPETGILEGSIMDITQRKSTQDEIKKSKELLESLNRRLMDIREEERTMIAMNLHDDIGQKLTALNLNITWLKSRIGVQSKVVKEKLEEMNLMIKDTIDGVQDFSSNLRPAILFDLGPDAAFDSYLKKFEKQSGIKCDFYHEPEVSEIENEISIVLYRILQESLTNIARHSGATTAEVTLRTVKNRIELIIKDNGIGIDIAKTDSPASMGIAGIKERAKMVNGKVLIKGEKNHGTTIRVTVPVKNVSNYD
jgi:PAS domain S-box-containing protein